MTVVPRGIRALAGAALLCALGAGMFGCVSNLPPQPPDAPSPNPNAGPIDPSEEATAPLLPDLPRAGKVAPPREGAYFGMYSPPAPFDLRQIDAAEQKARKQIVILAWYQPWAEGNRSRFDTGTVVAVMRRGQVPLITWEPWDPGPDANLLDDPAINAAYRLSTITTGKHDAYIRGWARAIRQLGGPVMLRPMQEMNGFWYPWAGTANGNTPADYVAAWRHIHGIFQEEGATNVTWVWSINHESVPQEDRNAYSVYYPGDEYVDWTAVSGFNWGESTQYSSWGSFEHWYAEPLEYLATLDKPICIAEIGAVEIGGDKAAWITDAYQQIRKRPQIKAVVYYDALEAGPATAQDWRVDTSRTSLSAFRSSVAPAYFIGVTPPALTTWAAALSPEQRLYIVSFSPLY